MTTRVLDVFSYHCSPKHKRGTFDAGPPRYQPGATKCPDDLLLSDIEGLLEGSIGVEDRPDCPHRFAFRRSTNGIEFFETKRGGTRTDDREPLHRHPVSAGEVPPAVLRHWYRAKLLTAAEYRSFVKAPRK
jgi:hypothetical protein